MEYFEYVCFLAIENLMMYENTRSLTFSSLYKFTMAFFDEIEKIFGNPNPFRENNNISFEEELKKFRQYNKDLFSFENGRITLKDSIDYEELYEIICSYHEVAKYRFVSKNTACLDALNIHTISDAIKSYYVYEQRLEQLYLELPYSKNPEKTKSDIKSLLFLRNLFYNNINSYKHYIIDAFSFESFRLEQEESHIPDDFNNKALENLTYCDKETLENEVYPQFVTFLQTSVFSNEKLYRAKFAYDISLFEGEIEKNEEMIFDSCDDEYTKSKYEEFDYDESPYEKFGFNEIDYYFYLRYLEKLDKYYNESHIEELLKTKYRIIYALDTGDLKLYETDGHNTELLNYKDEGIIDYISDLSTEVYFLIEELFVKEFDENTIKKTLFISTYYDITHDDVIFKLLSKYANNPIYPYVEEMIREEKNYELKLY